ncbi:MAG: SDR family NAD(P)-dependent oxidoreductase [Alphaproteobacteria bacterium]|nr:SDR family NAD(P)-dependent oxidoreductase [Alphaproteobacteria bacterium]
MSNVLIIGASSGLGKELAHQYFGQPDFHVTTVARSANEQKISDQHIQYDISKQENSENLLSIISERSYKLIIYCVSAWGESGEFKSEEIEQFVATGPMGFLKLIEKMIEHQILDEKASVFSIGSTTTLNSNAVLYGSNSPVYALAKEMQRFISLELQRKLLKKQASVTTLTVGGLGENRIKPIDIFKIINCFHSLSPECRPIELIMPSQTDFKL